MLGTSKLLAKHWKPMVTAVRRHPYPVEFMQMLANMPQPQYATLDNGFAIATEERDVPSVCFGLFMDGGSRYENDFDNGITHFFEHVVFKSTKARSKPKLEQQMSCLGAKFKCYTTREMACYYVECLPGDVTACLDILADCVYNNAFDDTEIELQKNVVYLEMQDHDLDHNAVLDDYLHRTAFQCTPLARTIIGPSCNLYNFNAKTLQLHLNKFFAVTRTVLAAVGCVCHADLVKLAKQYFGHMQPLRCVDSDFYRFCGSEIRFRNDAMPTALVAMAVEGPCMCDEDALVMELAASIMGGWDRTQPGGYNVAFYAGRSAAVSDTAVAYRAFNLTYKDTGLWGVKFESESVHLDDMLGTVQDQWMFLCKAMTETDVERGRRLLKTRILSQNESLWRSCCELARWTLYYGHRPALTARLTAIDRIDTTVLHETCARYIYDKCPAVALLGRTEGFPDYGRLRGGMYWLRW